MKVIFQNEKMICDEKKITDSVYFLTVKPGEKSKNISAYDLNEIYVLFFVDDYGELKSYATISYYYNPSYNKIQNSFESIYKVISEKYGSPIFLRNEQGSASNVSAEYVKRGYAPEFFDDIFRKTGFTLFVRDHDVGYVDYREGYFWRKNIGVFGGFWQDDRGIRLGSGNFLIIYYEPNIAAEVLENYQATLNEFTENLLKKQAREEVRAKDLF